MKRRSLSNPCLRSSESNRRTIQALKIRGSSVESSQIPRPRIRSLSTERLSGRKSTFPITGKASLGHAPTTPKTPSYPRSNVGLATGSRTGRSPSAERASTLAGKSSRKDTRPITDKVFQAQMLRKIDNYFHSLEQSNMLNTNGSIKPLTIKMFVEATNLLLGLLGVKHFLTNLNYVEEVPKIAKGLQYPGQISKAWLKTANAMHAFPQALAWLSWLVEMCELRDLALVQFCLENIPFSNIDDQAEKNRNMFFSMLNFYSAWNENLGREEGLVNEFLKEEEARYNVSDEALNRAQLDNETTTQELEKEDQLRMKVDTETRQLKDIITNLKHDIESIDLYSSEQNKHIQESSNEIKNIKSECLVLDDDKEIHFEKQKQLKVLIKKQPISPKERDEIVEKCEDVKKYLKQFEDHLQEIQKDVYSRDMKLASVNHNLTKVILEYNRHLHKYLDAISGVNIIDIQIPENVISSPHSVDILQEISSALTKVKEKLQKEFEEMKALIKLNELNVEHLQEQAKTLAEENVELKKKLKEKDTKISKIKARGKAEEAELRENVKKLEEKIKSVQDLRPDLESLQKELDDKTDKRDALKRQKEFLLKKTVNFFEKMYSILASHRKECSELFNKIIKHG